MSTELAAVAGFGVGGLGSYAATPFAVRLAERTEFYDHPGGYHRHQAPTPLLGGLAVLLAIVLAGLVIGATAGPYLVLVGCAAALCALGTLDDRVAVPPRWRLLAEAGAALALVAVGLGWKTTLPAAFNTALTVVWVAGLVTAFNLMDNIDGACAAVGCACAAGIGVLAATNDQAVLAGLAFALAGACLGFIPHNLAVPSRVFLGDGGSMTVGFLVAGLASATARHLHIGDARVLAGALLVGLPILDTTLVSVSRLRRGVTLLTGGRDHLTHRLLGKLGSPRSVAAILAAGQAVLCGVVVAADRLGSGAVAVVALLAVALGISAIALLESPAWRP